MKTVKIDIKPILLASLGAGLCIAGLASLQALSIPIVLVMAPFGATMVLLFALPDSPLAQPRNIVLGHLLTTTVGLLILGWLGVSPVTMGLAVGLSIGLMMLTKSVHPPAGANPLVVMLAAQSWEFLLTPVLTGTLIIVAIGWCYHRYAGLHRYPNKWW